MKQSSPKNKIFQNKKNETKQRKNKSAVYMMIYEITQKKIIIVAYTKLKVKYK